MIRFFPARKLSPIEVRLIPEALWLLFWARVTVSFVPSKRYLPAVANPAGTAEIELSLREFAAEAGKVIEGLARRTPWPSTCLVKALALRRILKRRGIPCTLHLGVHKNPPGKRMGAHAWLSVAGEVLIGGWRLERYAEIARME